MDYPSDTPPTVAEQTSPWPPQPTPAIASTAPRRNRRLVIIASIIGVLAVIGATVAITLVAAKPRASAQAPSAPQSEQAGPLTPVEEHDAPPEPDPTLAASDVKLSMKITEKQCFGSAGCNVSLKVQMAYAGLPLSSDDTWQVIYQITGADDGPVVGSFEVTGDQYTINEESVSTKSSKSKLQIKVTDVSKVGI